MTDKFTKKELREECEAFGIIVPKNANKKLLWDLFNEKIDEALAHIEAEEQRELEDDPCPYCCPSVYCSDTWQDCEISAARILRLLE